MNYKKIKNILEDVYDITEPFRFKEFEETKEYNNSLTELEYAKKYTKFAMGLDEDVAGAGAVTVAQPSSVPGQTIGGDGTVGNTISSPFGYNGRNVPPFKQNRAVGAIYNKPKKKGSTVTDNGETDRVMTFKEFKDKDKI
jgi:hypothetical protein